MDAILFLAREIFGFIYIIFWFIYAIGKAVLIIFKPLWFMLAFIVAFAKTFFYEQTWAPLYNFTISSETTTFVKALPGVASIISIVTILLMVVITIKIFKNEK